MIDKLPRREREVFEALCGCGEASASQIREKIASPPSHSAVRTLLTRLEKRGLIKYRVDGQTYLYRSVEKAATIRHSALEHLINTFFAGSAASAMTAMLGMSRKPTAEELDRLQDLIDQARERSR